MWQRFRCFKNLGLIIKAHKVMNINSILRKESFYFYPFLTFLLLVCLSVVPVKTYAQNESSLTLQVKNQKIEQVFTQITRQTQVKFFYDHETVRQVPEVTLNLNKVSLKESNLQFQEIICLTYLKQFRNM